MLKMSRAYFTCLESKEKIVIFVIRKNMEIELNNIDYIIFLLTKFFIV